MPPLRYRFKQPPFTPGYRKGVIVIGPASLQRPKPRPIIFGSSFFAYHYALGSIPASLCQDGRDSRIIQWKVNPSELDIEYLLPLFCNGLQEHQPPFATLSKEGALDLIEIGGEDRVCPLVADLVWQIRRALETRMDVPVLNSLKVMDALLDCGPKVAECLAIYCRYLLVPLKSLIRDGVNKGDYIDWNYESGCDVSSQVQIALQKIALIGGKRVIIEIKKFIPTFEAGERIYCINDLKDTVQ